METNNPYEIQHRYKKAIAIVDIIEKSNLTTEQIVKLSSKERDIIASLAKVNSPSEETWNKVVELHRMRKSGPLA